MLKKLSIIALVLIIAMAFTGCHVGEIKLYDAYMKTQDITSAETETTLSFNIKAEGFDEKFLPSSIVDILNSINFKINQKVIKNAENTASTAMADIGVILNLGEGDLYLNNSIWVDADLNEESYKLLEIFRLDPLISGFIPSDTGISKEYIKYDVLELMEFVGGGEEIGELLKFAEGAQSKSINILEGIKDSFRPGSRFINYKGKRLYYGEKQDVIEVKFDDKGYKDFLRYSVNYVLENEDILEILKEYMDIVTKMMIAQNKKSLSEGIDQDGLEALEGLEGLEEFEDLEDLEALLEGFEDLEDFDALLEGMEDQASMIKKAFDSFMDFLEDIQIIGDKGITIEYYISEDGYIVGEKGNIDLAIDIKEIAEAIKSLFSTTEEVVNAEETDIGEADVEETDAEANEEATEMSLGVLRISIDFETKILSINEEVDIELPELNEENSVNFMDLIMRP